MIYVYDGWNLIVEFDGAGNFQAWNIYGAEADEILARWVSGVGNFSYHSDKDGNVYALGTQAGKVRWMYRATGAVKGGPSFSKCTAHKATVMSLPC